MISVCFFVVVVFFFVFFFFLLLLFIYFFFFWWGGVGRGGGGLCVCFSIFSSGGRVEPFLSILVKRHKRNALK